MINYNKVVGNIHSIEHFGAFDGPGVRYVLFLQGCPFRCKYCHNRDTWSFDNNRLMTVEEIIKDFNKYKLFYKHGGITVSGGEPTRQLEFVKALFIEMKKLGVHTTLDTSGACFSEPRKQDFIELLRFTDLVLLDIKEFNNDTHKSLVGFSNRNVLKLAELLNDENKQTIIRYVLVPGITDNEADLHGLKEFGDTLTNITKIEVLPYHDVGKSKWYKMGLDYPFEGVRIPSVDEIEKVRNILNAL